MLLPVHHGYQDIEVTEQIAKATRRLQSHGKVRAFTPVLKRGVQRVTLSSDRVAHRLENPSEQGLAAPAGKDCNRSLERY